MQSKQSKGWVFTMVLASVVLATPAFAQDVYNASLALKCTEEISSDSGPEKIASVGAGTREFIALCNGLDPSDPANKDAIKTLVEEQTVVINSNNDLRVIDRCNPEIIFCEMELDDDGETCSVAEKETANKLTATGICVIEPGDLENFELEETAAFIDGSLRCKFSQSEKIEGETSTFSFSEGCKGNIAIAPADEGFDALPCTIKVGTGGLYKVPKSCDQPL